MAAADEGQWPPDQLGELSEARLQTMGLEPLYFEMLRAVESGPIYPDANGTLRLSYATVMGYAPRDGVWAKPQTALGALLAAQSQRLQRQRQFARVRSLVLPPSHSRVVLVHRVQGQSRLAPT